MGRWEAPYFTIWKLNIINITYWVWLQDIDLNIILPQFVIFNSLDDPGILWIKLKLIIIIIIDNIFAISTKWNLTWLMS